MFIVRYSVCIHTIIYNFTTFNIVFAIAEYEVKLASKPAHADLPILMIRPSKFST